MRSRNSSLRIRTVLKNFVSTPSFQRIRVSTNPFPFVFPYVNTSLNANIIFKVDITIMLML